MPEGEKRPHLVLHKISFARVLIYVGHSPGCCRGQQDFLNHSVHYYYITLVKVYYIKHDINVRDVVNRTREEGGGYSKLDIISKYDQQAGL